MKIKRIDIFGFKSFVEKTSLDFEEGITAVLGPNGCGKSNIVDAIRWAMGEQNAKHLRGRMMEDIIFGGSETRKPLGMAEVSLTFSNEDGLAPALYREYSEIMITRRLYRNGESEYLINKTPCRLLDITELFMDTGAGARTYSIIEQGKIGMILNAKPEDRRSLIEEAAGVTKYKSRKKSALRKIEATRQNLLRLGDIISEVRRQSGSLKRQAQKAERYRKLREEYRNIEIRFARRRFEELQLERDDAARGEEESCRNHDDISIQLNRAELHLEELRIAHAGAEKEVSRGQEKVFHLTGEIQQVEGKIGFGQKEMENLQRQTERLNRELDELGRSLENADGDEEALKSDEERLGQELERKTRDLAEGEGVLEELTDAERSLNERLEENRRALITVMGEMSRLGNLHEDAGRRLQLLEERTARNRREAVALNEQMEEARQLYLKVSEALREMEAERLRLEAERDEDQEKIRMLRTLSEEKEISLLNLREELSRFRSRLESLQELERNLEGYGGGVRSLMKNSLFRDRFSGLVADLLDVPDGLEIAVEAVLGDRLQALVAKRSLDVREALDFLRAEGGRCTFLLPVAGKKAVTAPSGGVPLKDLVGVRPEGEGAAEILDGIFLAEDLEPHLHASLSAGAVLVTKEGEFLTHRGEINGGAEEDLSQGLLQKKREIKNLEQKIAEYARLVAGAEQERLSLREDFQDTEARLRKVQESLHRQELKTADSRKDLQRLQQEDGRLRERLEVLGLEEDQLHEERVGLEGQQSQTEQERKEKDGKKEILEEAVAEVQEALREHALQLGKVRERVISLKVDVASLREREQGRRRNLERLVKQRQELRGRLALDRSRRKEAELEHANLRKEEERLQVELEILYRKREEENKRFDSVREKFDQMGLRIREREGEVKEFGARLHRERDALASRQLKVRELELQAENLRQNILSRYRLDLVGADECAMGNEESFDVSSAERRIEELDRILEGMGEVNLTAIEESKELEERHKFLVFQQEDLRQSLDGLQAAITKINRTTRRRFREAFDQINDKFQEIFPRLFRGGKAELRLTDEEDLLETGIDIIVQPPGKKLQNVNLLSGGEKALTAVALIFSIFLIKPSPFCLLDEVDAPLDDANIGRFNEMIREMAKRSQFILITHNKRTMEVADVLYGITMEEPGISKVVSVRINDFGVADAV